VIVGRRAYRAGPQLVEFPIQPNRMEDIVGCPVFITASGERVERFRRCDCKVDLRGKLRNHRKWRSGIRCRLRDPSVTLDAIYMAVKDLGSMLPHLSAFYLNLARARIQSRKNS